jgi:hypothetical protein
MKFVKGEPRPATAGRKRGTPNKVTKQMLGEFADSGDLPLDHLLKVMRDVNEDKHVRLAAAKAAAPFMHSTLQSVALAQVNLDGTPITPEITNVFMEAPKQRGDAPVMLIEPPSDSRH